MPQISKEKREKIKEQILFYLYSIFPKQIFTSEIAKEVARDEEFTKSLLLELKKSELVAEVDKNPSGIKYLRRARWRLSTKAHKAYSNHQHSPRQQY